MNQQLASQQVLVLEGYALDVHQEKGHLSVTDGFANEAPLNRQILARGNCEVQRIIVRAPAGTITVGALDWCHRMGITLAIVGSDSRLINCLIPDAPHDGPVKRAQAIAGVTDFGVDLCRWLLKRKFSSQIEGLSLLSEIFASEISAKILRETLPEILPKALQDEIRSCEAGLLACDTLDGFLALEGTAAKAYWQFLTGRALPWPPWTHKRIPAHWRAICSRDSGARSMVRDARDPFNAILNYSYTLLEVEARIACVAHGLDPDLGLLHVDNRLRESFIFDLVEPIRASVDLWALEMISKSGLRPYMFHELRDGVVRLDPDLAKSLAQNLMPKMRGPAMDLASQYVTQLRKVEIPYRLQRFGGKRSTFVPEPASAANCGYCKQPLHKKGLKFCSRRCYLRHSVEIRQPIKAAHAKLAEMRARGLSPGHGGRAAKIRGAKIATSNRRRAIPMTPGERRERRATQARKRRAIPKKDEAQK